MVTRSLESDPRLSVVAAASDINEARLLFAAGTIDVAVVDVNLPDGNGVAFGVELQERDPSVAIILLSTEDVMGMFNSVQATAPKPWSYLSKRSTFADNVLISAVAAAAEGGVVIDPYLAQQSEARAGTVLAQLSSAQYQVLQAVAEGLSNHGVAARLGLTVRSVESHLQAIYRTLGIDESDLNRRVAAVLAFIEQTGRSSWPR